MDELREFQVVTFPCGESAKVTRGGGLYMQFTPHEKAPTFLRARLGDDFHERIRAAQGYQSPGIWPASRTLGDLTKVVEMIMATYKPKVINSREDMEALYD